MSLAGPLVDFCGRVHTDLRISVTDRCNIRCYYCMPPEGVRFLSHHDILTYEEIERFVLVAARLGIRKLRITGGEPLVRKGVPHLVEKLVGLHGVEEVALTTNGILLRRLAGDLRTAGLNRLNVSLDTLDREKFRRITQFDELPRVLEGIEAAQKAGFAVIKLNTLAIRGMCEDDVVPLARFARDNGLHLRFIEFMPVGGRRVWGSDQVLPGDEILEILSREIGPLDAVETAGPYAPATEYEFRDGGGRIGVIRSVTEPFCDQCNRLRLTADGKLQNCLFSPDTWDARAVLRSGATQRRLAQLIQIAVSTKRKARGTDTGDFAPAERSMHQIGG
ncbi:MAG: GTP 3',8-cyclase MoaA [Pirellulales bacterium]|nr:GTP 3',8-cyclase MoaA [Pirellulales bacterium]